MAAPTKPLLKFLTLTAIAALIAGCGQEGGAELGNRAQLGNEPTLDIATGLADEARENLSGAACESRARCLLIGDEMRHARLFSLDDGKLVPGKELWLLAEKDAAGEEMKESDGEGVAFSDGHFYIVGSHSRSKKGKEQSSRHHLWRIPASALDDLGSLAAPAPGLKSTSLDFLLTKKSFGDRLGMAPGVWAPGEDNLYDADQRGVSIEGLAVSGDKVFVGFRGPVDVDGAYLYELSRDALFARKPDEPPPNAVLHRVKLGGSTDFHCQGIRDLAAVPGGLLILSGPEMRLRKEPKLKKGDVAKPRPAPTPPFDRCHPSQPRAELFFWSGSGQPRRIAPIDTASLNGDSPEAIAILPGESAEYEILVLSDGGASKPMLLRIPKAGLSGGG